MFNVAVIAKDSWQVLFTGQADHAVLDESSIVQVGVDKEQIDRFDRVGNSIVITLLDGKTVTIDNFFNNANTADNSLVIQDDDESLYLVGYEHNGAETNFIEFALLDSIEPLLYLHEEESTSVLPWLFPVAAAGGIYLWAERDDDDKIAKPPLEVTLEDDNQTVTGKTDPNTKYEIRDKDGNVLAEGESDENGNFTVELDEPLEEDEAIDVVAIDEFGQESSVELVGADVTPPTAMVDIDEDSNQVTIQFDEKVFDPTTNGELTAAELAELLDVDNATLTNAVFDGETFTATIVPDDQFKGDVQVTVPAGAVVDKAGLPVEEVSDSYDVDTQITDPDDYSPYLTINDVTEDNILNQDEMAAGVDISGTVAALAADETATITVTVNGENYSAEVAADNTWTVTVPGTQLAADADQTIEAVANIADDAGNTEQSDVVKKEYQVDTNITNPDDYSPYITIDDLTADNILNASEVSADVDVTGKVAALAADETATITVTINGEDYTANVAADNTWKVTVPGAQLAADADQTIEAVADILDTAGNSEQSDVVEKEYQVNTGITNPDDFDQYLTIDDITEDNVLNENEASGNVEVTGAVAALAAGETAVITVTINGKEYTTEVADDNTWKVSVAGTELAADSDHTVEAKADLSNEAGNTADSDVVEKEYGVDTDITNPAEIEGYLAIDAISDDDVLNAQEIQATNNVEVTGRLLSLNADETAVVTVQLNGQTQTVNVNPSDLTWSVNFIGSDFAADAAKEVTASAVINDTAGNTANADEVSRGYDILTDVEVGVLGLLEYDDTGASASDYIGQDNNYLLNVTGIAASSTVVYQLQDGPDWKTTPLDQINLADGSYTYRAQVTDSAGNTDYTNSVTVVVDTVVDTTNLDVSLSDFEDTGRSDSDYLTKDDSYAVNVDGVETGSSVVVEYSKDGGGWSALGPAVIASSGQASFDHSFAEGGADDGVYQYQAVITDIAGNTATKALTGDAAQDLSITVDRTKPSEITEVTMEMLNSKFDAKAIGYSEPNSQVKIYVNNESQDILVDGSEYLGQAVVGEDGRFEFDFSRPLPVQTNSWFVFEIEDAAGNVEIHSYDRIDPLTIRNKAFVLRNDEDYFEGVASISPDNYDSAYVEIVTKDSGSVVSTTIAELDGYGRFKVTQAELGSKLGSTIEVTLHDPDGSGTSAPFSYYGQEHDGGIPTTESTAADDVFSESRGVYRFDLLDDNDATGGNGHDVFTNAIIADDNTLLLKIDMASLFEGQNVQENVNVSDYLVADYDGADTTVSIDRDGSGGEFGFTEIATFKNSDFSLQDILLTNQLWYY